MKYFFICTFLICSLFIHAQRIFFKSNQTYTEEHLANIYASITSNNNILLFNAPDYKLYAYDLKNGAHKWTYNLGWKSSVPPFFLQHFILANNHKEQVVQVDTSNGSLIKILPFNNIYNQPIIKNNILYTTGIYEAGNLIAYSIEKDSVLWHYFLAHGYERKPYYYKNKIWANGESDNWFELDYNGKILTPGCDTTDPEYPHTNECSIKFIGLTHNGKKISGKLATKLDLSEYEDPEMIYTSNATLILNNDALHIIGNNGNLKSTIELQALLPEEMENNTYSKAQFIKVNNGIVWMLYNDKLLAYKLKEKKLGKIIDLSAWHPHQGLIDKNNFWFISKNDGLLYGMEIN